MKVKTVAFLVLFFMPLCAFSQEKDFRIRDPFVLVDGGKYYLYESCLIPIINNRQLWFALTQIL